MLMWDNLFKLKAMFWLYIFISSILSSTSANEEIIRISKDLQDLSRTDLKQTIINVIQYRCVKNANRQAFVALKVAFLNVRFCMAENIRRPADIPTNSTDTLKDALITTSSGLYKCAESVLEKAEPCLNLEEKYLPELILDSFNASTHRLFKDDGTIIEARLAAFQSTNCTPSNQVLPQQLLETCVPKLDHLKALRVSDYVLKQSDFCYDLKIAYDCVIDAVKLQCNDDEVIVEYYKEMFERFLHFCENNVAADSKITQVLFD